jgi:hypothetical protein
MIYARPQAGHEHVAVHALLGLLFLALPGCTLRNSPALASPRSQFSIYIIYWSIIFLGSKCGALSYLLHRGRQLISLTMSEIRASICRAVPWLHASRGVNSRHGIRRCRSFRNCQHLWLLSPFPSSPPPLSFLLILNRQGFRRACSRGLECATKRRPPSRLFASPLRAMMTSG